MGVLVDITLPEAEAGADAVVERWLHRIGDQVRINEPLLEVNTDKAVVEVPAPATGILREILKPVNETIRMGDVLGRIEVGEAAAMPRAPAAAKKNARDISTETSSSATSAELSPAVRQLVKKHNADVSRIRGTGRGGRITLEDVQTYLRSQESKSAAGRRVPHTPTRRRIAEHMVNSLLKTAPHVTAVFEVDLSAIIAHRQSVREAYQQKGAQLTYTAYFVSAAVQAISAVPEINSRWHDDGLEILGDCNIGVAAATDAGLVVPVIHQAQNLDLHGIACRLQELTQRARSGKLTPDDMRGGTLTITNHGVSGSLIATPIINQPQSAILGIGKIEKRVVVVEIDGSDSIQIRPMAYVTLTIDHRALDGYQANAFLSKFAQVLQEWPAIE